MENLTNSDQPVSAARGPWIPGPDDLSLVTHLSDIIYVT